MLAPAASSLLPQATAALLLLLSGNGGDDAAGLLDNRDCSDVPRNCVQELVGCLTDPDCIGGLLCIFDCGFDDAECAFACSQLLLEVDSFLDISQCLADNDCLPDYPPDGECLADDEDALQTITEIEQVQGDWWVVKGQNCGQEGWPGALDWFPCQHGRIIEVEGRGWVNNVTYCSGTDSVCTSDIINTTPDCKLTSPGVTTMTYPEGEAPIQPQVENWRWVSYPHPDWAFVVWCGSNPATDFAGAFVYTRNRSLAPLDDLPEVEAELRATAESFGIDFDEMCVSDNTDCPV